MLKQSVYAFCLHVHVDVCASAAYAVLVLLPSLNYLTERIMFRTDRPW